MLHASYLAFIHPTTGEKVTFKAEVPDDFRELVQLLDADQAQKGRGL
jgi:23S rRNA pseudouridine1911/1915/1917 synthase